jgi:hypothetical protein
MGEGVEADLRARVETRSRALAGAFADLDYAGRGIVIAAGGARLFVNAYVLIHLLRRTLKCTAPIEVWHYGEGELSPHMRALLAELGAATIDAAPMAERAGVTIRDGWQLKPFVLAVCRFAEVLMLDADQVPVVDPSVAFDWPRYREAGAVFWPDILDLKAENPIWAALGLPAAQTISLESGQVLIDKRRHLPALLATLALNEAADTTYRYVYGDKDTFLLGWRLTGAPFALVPHRPFAQERSLVQRDFDGAPFLQHRTNCKWTYAGEQHAFKEAAHQSACLAALSQLRAQWNGRIFTPPPRSARARRIEAWLIGALRLRCEVVGDDRFALEFWPDGELGEGRAQDRANWSVEEDPANSAEFTLTLWGGHGRPTYRIRRHADGLWRGERYRFPRMPIAGVLEPIATSPVSPPGAGRSLVDDFVAAAEFAADGEDSELRAALVLLSRIEAGVAARLRVLARALTPQRAARLEALAAAIGETPASALGEVARDFPSVEDGYLRTPELLSRGDQIA